MIIIDLLELDSRRQYNCDIQKELSILAFFGI